MHIKNCTLLILVLGYRVYCMKYTAILLSLKLQFNLKCDQFMFYSIHILCKFVGWVLFKKECHHLLPLKMWPILPSRWQTVQDYYMQKHMHIHKSMAPLWALHLCPLPLLNVCLWGGFHLLSTTEGGLHGVALLLSEMTSSLWVESYIYSRWSWSISYTVYCLSIQHESRDMFIHHACLHTTTYTVLAHGSADLINTLTGTSACHIRPTTHTFTYAQCNNFDICRQTLF